MGATLRRYGRILHLADGAADTEDGSDTVGAPTEEALAEHPAARLAGLHAKIIVTDDGWDASMMIGSANATEAGLGGNVELMVELIGRRARCGVDAVLGDADHDGSLSAMLNEYRRTEDEPAPTTDAERVAYRLDSYGRELAKIAFTAAVEADGELFRLRITGDRSLPKGEVAIRMWPITLTPDTQSADPEPGNPIAATFTGLSLTAITSFFAFELNADSEDGPVSTHLVINARLVGAPEDRHQRILTAQLGTRADVIRYLLLLLAAIGDDSAQIMADALLKASSDGQSSPHGFQVPLLESMVRALSRSPEALDHVARLIEDLSSTDGGRDLLPEGIADVWGPIWEARQELRFMTEYDFSKVYAGLKDFQLDTVEYAFQRMYLDDPAARRFLVADEVGLGKTLVARGLIARAIEHLDDQGVDRIDVVYICSNSNIARQNISRLNVTGQQDFAFASRITLLASQLRQLTKNRLNFVSFTPGTSFDLKSNLGQQDERKLLYWLLRWAWGFPGSKGPMRVFQGTVTDFDSWQHRLRDYRARGSR